MLRKNEVYSEVKKILMEHYKMLNEKTSDSHHSKVTKEVVDKVFSLVLGSKN